MEDTVVFAGDARGTRRRRCDGGGLERGHGRLISRQVVLAEKRVIDNQSSAKSLVSGSAVPPGRYFGAVGNSEDSSAGPGLPDGKRPIWLGGSQPIAITVEGGSRISFYSYDLPARFDFSAAQIEMVRSGRDFEVIVNEDNPAITWAQQNQISETDKATKADVFGQESTVYFAR
jgi:hypothetical protein